MGLGRVELPDGCFGAPDPLDERKLTFWVVRSGRLKVWPPHVRYAPFPPVGVGRAEREAWYQSTYYPWLRSVVAEIGADLRAAEALFRAEAPFADGVPADYGARRRGPRSCPPRPRRARRVTERQIRLAGQREQAVALRRVGLSFAEIASTLGISKTTAYRWVQFAASGRATKALMLDRANELAGSLVAATWASEGEQAERARVLLAEVRLLRDRLRRDVVS